MTLADIKLIATDMDGTLLNSGHEISPHFYPLFKELIAHNILFAVASGRQFFNLEKQFEDLKNDIIFVSENGSYVVYRGEELHIQEIEKEIVRDLIKTARGIPGANSIICGKKMAYVESSAPEFLAQVHLYFERFAVVDDLLQVEDDQFLKFTLCDLAGSEQNSYPFYKHLHGTLQVKVSGSIWLDISHKEAHKGKAMEVLQKIFGLSKDQTMVFGDYLNDKEMLQQAGFSYAMENAHPDVKAVARFHAKSNNEDGVVEVLQQVVDALQSR